MRRAWLALAILGAGAFGFLAFRVAATHIRRDLSAELSRWQIQTQQLAQLALEKRQVLERWNETQRQRAAQPTPPAFLQLAEKVLSDSSLQNLSDAEHEQLLAELGFDWSTTGDYVIISKQSLGRISFDVFRGLKLTDAALAALAITPAEQSAIESMTAQLGEARTAWAREHVQRDEPGGNVVAQYSLPMDAEFSQTQLSSFTNGIFSALGNERGKRLQDQSIGWMIDLGLRTEQDFSKVPAELRAAMPASEYEPKRTTLTLEKYKSGNEWRINYTLRQAGNTLSSSVLPWQPFPEAFKPIFPGGWKELAEREGFELPKEFRRE